MSPLPSLQPNLPDSCSLDGDGVADDDQNGYGHGYDDSMSSRASSDENGSIASGNMRVPAGPIRTPLNARAGKLLDGRTPPLLHQMVDQEETMASTTSATTTAVEGSSRLLERLALSDRRAVEASKTSHVSFNPHHRLSLPHLANSSIGMGNQRHQQQQQQQLLHNYLQSSSSSVSASGSSDGGIKGSELLLNPQLAQQLSLNGLLLQPPLASSIIPKKISLYKTELCRTFEETGYCRYGTKCQFAHDRGELRVIPRHPRYKTEICRTFWEHGNCPYGKRCCFIHLEAPLGAVSLVATGTTSLGLEAGRFVRSRSLAFPSPLPVGPLDKAFVPSSSLSVSLSSLSLSSSSALSSSSSTRTISPDLSNWVPPPHVTTYTEAQDALTAFLWQQQQQQQHQQQQQEKERIHANVGSSSSLVFPSNGTRASHGAPGAQETQGSQGSLGCQRSQRSFESRGSQLFAGSGKEAKVQHQQQHVPQSQMKRLSFQPSIQPQKHVYPQSHQQLLLRRASATDLPSSLVMPAFELSHGTRSPSSLQPN